MLPNSELSILCYEIRIFQEIKLWMIVKISELKEVLKLLSVRMRGRFWTCICLTGNVEYTGHWWLMWKKSSHTYRVPL